MSQDAPEIGHEHPGPAQVGDRLGHSDKHAVRPAQRWSAPVTTIAWRLGHILVGEGLDDAEAVVLAERAGFTIAYGEPRYDENVAKDVVLSQSPASSARIVKDGTITLTLSLGPERYQVPDVVGKRFELAQSELEQASLVVKKGPDRFDDNLPKGVVVAVDPATKAETPLLLGAGGGYIAFDSAGSLYSRRRASSMR